MSINDPQQAGSGRVFLPIYIAMFSCMAAMMGFVSMAGAMAKTFALAPWQIGMTVTVSGLVWVLASRAWGQRSDRVGRRPVLQRGALIFVVAYALMTLSVGVGQATGLTGWLMLALLALTRAGMGLGFAAIPTAANAYIADRTQPEERAGQMGRLGAMQAMGMIAGPALVSLLAWAGVVLPLAVLAVMPFVALVALQRGLTEPVVERGEQRPPLSMLDARLRTVCLIGIGAMFCVGIAQISVGFLVIDRFGMTPTQGAQYAGIALTVVGIALIPAQLSVRALGWTPAVLLMAGASLAALGFLCSALSAHIAVLLIGYALSGFGLGWVFAGISAQAANSVSGEEQGRAAGAVSASQGLGVMVGPLAGALLYGIAPSIPYLAGAALLIILAGLAFSVRLRATGTTPTRDT
ncbi:MAG: MFS transporter [Paracoccaceae bacterium]